MAIASRGLQLAVSEQHLDHADIDLILQQVGGKAVAQGMDAAFVYAGFFLAR